MALAEQHACTSNVILKKCIVCALPLSCVARPLLQTLRRFPVVEGSRWLKLQLAVLWCFGISSLYSSRGSGAAPLRSGLSSTVC